MKLSEKLSHMFKQYNYRRKRASMNHKTSNKFEIEEFLAEVDLYIDEVIEDINNLLTKGKKL